MLVRGVVGMMLAASLYAIVGPATAASAVTAPGTLTVPLQNDIVVTQPDGEKPLVSADVVIQPGESRRLIGVVLASMDTTTQVNMDFTATIRCVNASLVQAAVAATAQVDILPNETKALRPTVLFAPTASGWYRCYLIAQTGSTNGPSMTVHKTQTVLQVSAGDEVGSHMWQNPPCDSAGNLPTCTYLGESGGPTQKYVLDNDGSVNNDGSSPLLPWTAGATATAIAVTANVEVTQCGHTASCGGRKHDGSSSTVSSHLEVVQLDDLGNHCNATWSDEHTDVIGKFHHHYNIAYSLSSVPVLATCGSRNFRVRVDMKWVSGNSVKIDGTRPDPLVHTNAVAINSAYAASTATVPGLLGLNQAAAQTALTAANLTLGTVTTVDSPAPTGTVIDQNPPAGTARPAGSPVNLTVSRATIAVPQVIGLKLSQATSVLLAAGLGNPTRHTRLDLNCNEPIGTVVGQNPGVGTPEPAGFSVTVDVEAWPTQGCSTS